MFAGFSGDDFIAHQQVHVPGTVDMLTKEHPKQRGPRDHVANKRCTVRQQPPCPAQREIPSMVNRPVITSMAQAIRLHWRKVVVVTWGWRHWKSATMSIVGFFVG